MFLLRIWWFHLISCLREISIKRLGKSSTFNYYRSDPSQVIIPIYNTCYSEVEEPGFNSNLILALNQFEKMPHQWGIGSCFDIGSLFGGGWTENSYGVSLHQGLSCHFMLLLVCLHLFKDALRQGGLNQLHHIPGNLGNIFRSCMGLSLSSALFTPYFHHQKKTERRLEHFHPILSGVHHLSTGKKKRLDVLSVWYLCM